MINRINNLSATRLGFLALCFVVLRGDSCGDVIDNPGFDLWCDDALCLWELETGDIERVPTWHSADAGVALLGAPVVLSQLSDTDSTQVTCLRFELIADVDESSSVFVEMDFLDDGVAEFSQRIPASNWEPLSFLVKTPTWYRDVRFSIRKSSGGRAVLAQIAAKSSSDCTGPAMELLDRPLGAPCDADVECLGSVCGPGTYAGSTNLPPILCGADCQDYGTCHGCVADDDCGGSQACGVEFGGIEAHRACGTVARHSLGERCFQDSECATGVCCGGACSTCCIDDDCGGASCRRRSTIAGASIGDPDDFAALVALPFQCRPEAGVSLAGAGCLEDNDCQSATCTGSGDLQVCLFDGRPCTADADCPLGGLVAGFDLPLSDNACVTVGVAAGICQ